MVYLIEQLSLSLFEVQALILSFTELDLKVFQDAFSAMFVGFTVMPENIASSLNILIIRWLVTLYFFH